MANKHLMMLSDLYGRIGQTLREHGDAPIGRVRMPSHPEEPHLPAEWIEPVYIAVTPVTTEIDGVKHRTYEITEDL